jgi:hypothetical protein
MICPVRCHQAEYVIDTSFVAAQPSNNDADKAFILQPL